MRNPDIKDIVVFKYDRFGFKCSNNAYENYFVGFILEKRNRSVPYCKAVTEYKMNDFYFWNSNDDRLTPLYISFEWVREYEIEEIIGVVVAPGVWKKSLDTNEDCTANYIQYKIQECYFSKELKYELNSVWGRNADKENNNIWHCRAVNMIDFNREVTDDVVNYVVKDIEVVNEIWHKFHKNKKGTMMIKNVIHNAPATIVFWEDGTKTVVKCGEHDIYDPEKGLAMAIAKRALGDKGNYYETFKKWLPKETEKKDSKPARIGKVEKVNADGNGVTFTATVDDDALKNFLEKLYEDLPND